MSAPPVAEAGPLGKAVRWVAAAGIVGLVLAYLLPRDPMDRWVASVGVLAAAGSGVASLWLKRRAVEQSVNAALKVLGIIFGVRLALVVVGLVWTSRAALSPLPFVAGFFGEYFALQWIEVSYVLAELKRRGQGGK